MAPPSPRKRIHFASMMAMGMERINDVPPIAIILPSQPIASTPIRNLRQSVFKPVSEHIERTHGTPLRKSGTTTDVRPPTVPPKLVTRSTSGEIYYSANEDDVATPKRKVSREEVYSTPLEFGKGGENLAENL
ncbi:hypothetical protein CRE_11536 [Caenorhabditis remanei]|uniref:Uncharacterized protein n=1 Tax=Caenorhabditis remanei TaxID=31234 RepID=E3NMT2_CAERE|nr:hypothetical protein CRE_11536 [Caenorhabditis remanei]